ncbi:MAG: DUF5691 domain-containing protein [Bacteroidota bacterium]
MSTPPLTDQWPELLRQLLLGTDQQPSTPAEAAEDPAAQLLTDVGTAHLLRRGAQALRTWSDNIPTLAAAETRRACSWRSIQHLQTILSGDRLSALPEFARLLERHDRCLPPESLPDLLNQCVEDASLWPLLQPILGQRGQWLLAQHPAWSRLAISLAQAQEWPNVKGKEQLTLFQRFRRLDPAAARADLLLRWSQLTHQQQARILPALAVNLSAADETFLETARLAKRKPIRLAACDLLARLPDSALVNRLWEHAKTVVQRRGKTITVTLPDPLPKAMIADGIERKGSKTRLGLGGNWLLQLLSRLPISRWEQHWQLDSSALFGEVAQSDTAQIWLSAWVESLSRFPNTVATRTLLRGWLLRDDDTLWDNPKAKQLLRQADSDIFNECLIPWVQQHGPLIYEGSMAAYWLGLGQHAWDPVLSKFIVFGFRDLLQTRRIPEWELYHYRRILQAGAYQSDPALFDVFKRGWSFQSSGFGRWQVEVEQLLQTLNFRREMRAALATTT